MLPIDIMRIDKLLIDRLLIDKLLIHKLMVGKAIIDKVMTNNKLMIGNRRSRSLIDIFYYNLRRTQQMVIDELLLKLWTDPATFVNMGGPAS